MSPHPIGFAADYALERSRLTVFFRYFMLLPLLLVGILYTLALIVTWPLAGLAVLFTARYPAGLYRFNGGVLRFTTRVNAYGALLTDAYPPFGTGEEPGYPVRLTIGPPAERYSRLRVPLRSFFGFPVLLLNWGISTMGAIAALVSWFWILFKGRQVQGLHDALALSTAYAARASAYFMFMTEAYPPFTPDGPTMVTPEAPALT